MPDWRAILHRDGPAAWRAAYRLVGDRQDADECLQEAAEKLRDAGTLSYRMTTEIPGLSEPVVVRHSWEGRRLRAEAGAAGGPVQITDLETGASLVLDPAARSAARLEATTPPYGFVPSPADRLRDLAVAAGEPVGTRTIDGVRASGFRVAAGDQELTAWVDPGSHLPLLVEGTSRARSRSLPADARFTIDEVVLDAPLDDDLFRLDPPEGYALVEPTAAPEPATAPEPTGPEAPIVTLLRLYAEDSGGSFPTAVDDWAAYDEAARGVKFSGPAEPRAAPTGPGHHRGRPLPPAAQGPDRLTLRGRPPRRRRRGPLLAPPRGHRELSGRLRRPPRRGGRRGPPPGARRARPQTGPAAPSGPVPIRRTPPSAPRTASASSPSPRRSCFSAVVGSSCSAAGSEGGAPGRRSSPRPRPGKPPAPGPPRRSPVGRGQRRRGLACGSRSTWTTR